MCRWMAYQGEPVYLESLLFKQEHSLIHQGALAFYVCLFGWRTSHSRAFFQ